MILTFSATGNSAYAAKRIGEALQDDVLDLFDKIRKNDYTPLFSEQPWIVVTPTYAWRIPRIVHNWLLNTPLTGNRTVYFVMTCGGNIANAGAYTRKLCQSKKMNYSGCFEVVMPENYLALFNTPNQEEAKLIIDQAKIQLDDVILQIKNRQFNPPTITMKDRLCSGIVNLLFYPFFVHAKKFYVTEKCIGCQRCKKVCPLNNIEMEKGKPKWLDHCTHCMACIAHCPTEAIEYGKNSKGKPRYRCPENL